MASQEEHNNLPPEIELIEMPSLTNGRLIMGLEGWMDGGEVSTGTVETLVEKLDAQEAAEIHPEPFYIYNFPGSMEISALFRPHIEMSNGMLKDYQEPQNMFYAAPGQQLMLFLGKEPNLSWHSYTDCFFEFIKACGVSEVYFVGSVAGLVPHTRDPRVSASVSHEDMRPRLEDLGLRPSFYEGPGSIVNSFLQAAPDFDIRMMSLVAEIPAYVQGRNPRCIEVMVRRLCGMLNLDLNFESLRQLSDILEKKIDEAVAEREELAEHIKKLEENYDRELFETEMGDLKSWLQDQGIRLD